MLDGSGPIWETVRRAVDALRAEGIPVAVLGGLAVFSHGYRRNTNDVDLLVFAEDQDRIRRTLDAAGIGWSQGRRAFVGPEHTPLHLLFAGERIESTEIRNPGPVAANTSMMRGLPTLRLARLIEIKLAVALSVPRRTHRDMADVVELIAVNKLTKPFAAKLHRSLRAEFKRLVEVARQPKGRY